MERCVVPFCNPDAPDTDSGLVVADPGMHLNMPLALRYDNDRDNPVYLRNEGLQEDVRLYISDGRIHFEREPWKSVRSPGAEDVVLSLHAYLNPEAGTSVPLVNPGGGPFDLTNLGMSGCVGAAWQLHHECRARAQSALGA